MMNVDPQKPGSILSAIEARRISNGISQIKLCDFAAVDERWYRRILADPDRGSSTFVKKLDDALRMLIAINSKAKVKASATPPLLPATYACFFALSSQHYGIDPVSARALLVGEERPADPIWRKASHARQATLYLVNTSLAVSQAALASIARLTPAGVCLALRQVEDRRDDDLAFNAFLDRMHLVSTGEAPL